MRYGMIHAVLLATATRSRASVPNNLYGAQFPPNDHAHFHYFALQVDARSQESVQHTHVSRRALHMRAEQIAAELSSAEVTMHFVGRVGELADYFQVAVKKGLNGSEAKPAMQVQQEDEWDHLIEERVMRVLLAHPEVRWAEKQVPTRRVVKRQIPIEVPLPNAHVYAAANVRSRNSVGTGRIAEASQQFGISDPEFPNQWHLINETPGQIGNDHNVTAAWKQGIFGNGSTVCFVDDGIDYTSNDLKDNYVSFARLGTTLFIQSHHPPCGTHKFAEGSYDYNLHSSDPKPKTWEDRHGTRCAGEVAAVRNNVCGVGIAYHAKVSAVRILGGALTEADEAASINFKFDQNHIYSCSWGPMDNGKTMAKPPRIVSDAVLNGVRNGRGGLGSIFVFASGNGGTSGDNCNFDGYTNSIYTITVSSVDRNNQHPTYAESCSANMIVMYSSANERHDDAIATTDWSQSHVGDLCTKMHGGTSASAPLAAGIYALVNSIRPDLNWRDYQHITVRSAVPVNIAHPSWAKTYDGRLYSHDFGYGKLDTWAILELAKTWNTVAPQTSLIMPFVAPAGDGAIPQDANQDVRVQFEVTVDALHVVKFGKLEHVTITVNIQHSKRGDVGVDLVSPHNIVSHLAVKRHGDRATTGFPAWTFMSVAHWDEDPVGTWQLIVRDAETPNTAGTFQNASLTLWGSEAGFIKKKPDVLGQVPPTSISTLASAFAASSNATAIDRATNGSTPAAGTNGSAKPATIAIGFGGFFAFLAFLSLSGGAWYAYLHRTAIIESILMRQQRMTDDELGAELFEFRRPSLDVNEGTDEFEDFEGLSDAEIEELRKGGYLVDDLLDIDDTQASNL
ncbi:peptidase S8/S53 domain-containing protein [Chytriomyces sp. MP71]|nr:peptidase S8/S53 domain-containing protein [Chytriomyces sp. MP71]